MGSITLQQASGIALAVKLKLPGSPRLGILDL
jgi:hypothetical protein